ncbi:formate dehydrogenase accessory sulfurtransferase FdhD [Nakamurella sp. A5-74]|uniref:Sulfur carrier protein FdhD n=1 Tax=Nakamurella sp. A5-74 TaxID=3158264 RepID=A0AAU8DVX0_9ACTN
MVRRAPRRPVLRLRLDGDEVRSETRADTIAGEEPLEIRVNGSAFSVTMRTPGDDFDLAVGFLVGEGIVSGAADITQISYGPGVDASGRASYNIVDVQLASGVSPPAPEDARRVYTSSSCGICGTSSIEGVQKASRHPVMDDPARIGLAALLALPDRLRAQQDLFRRTGGVHAAALFDVSDPTAEPALVVLREDVGRHNAVDKVIGHCQRQGSLPLQHSVLQVSGRASFELVQKASMAGIPVLAAVSAPSDLAVALAAETGLTLAGFSRGDSVNVYSATQRIITAR